MKRYKAREGVVLTSVCGESLLVSAAALRDICPFVTVLNDSSAFLWKQLQNWLRKALMRKSSTSIP